MKLFLIAIALMCAAVASAQNNYGDDVYNQLQRAYNTVRSYGDVKLERTVINNINDGATDDWTFYFQSSKNYIIVAACDRDCSDVDLYVTKQGYTRNIVSDTDSDDIAVGNFKPSSSGRYTVKIKMYDCNTSYCYHGFSIYSY